MIRAAFALGFGGLSSACSPGQPSGDVREADPRIATSFNERHTSPLMPAVRLRVVSERASATVKLEVNEATRALVRMLPLTITMRDHLGQEKTGTLPSPLPESARQTRFQAGTVGLWGNDDFVIYYRSGNVPRPGIIVLGRTNDDLKMLENTESVTVELLSSE